MTQAWTEDDHATLNTVAGLLGETIASYGIDVRDVVRALRIEEPDVWDPGGRGIRVLLFSPVPLQPGRQMPVHEGGVTWSKRKTAH